MDGLLAGLIHRSIAATEHSTIRAFECVEGKRVGRQMGDRSVWALAAISSGALQRTFVVALAVAISLLLLVSSGAHSQPADYPIAGGWFFTQTGGDTEDTSDGYAVVDDSDARFWTAFREFGGVQTVGYPVTQRFRWDGFETQVFQKAAFQWRADTGKVEFINVFDDLHRLGFDEALEARLIPRQEQFDEEGLEFGEIIARRISLLEAEPALRGKFENVTDPVRWFGLPQSQVREFGDGLLRSVRLQRAVLQLWTEDVPWASAGTVTVANGGEEAKALGLWPADSAGPAALPEVPDGSVVSVSVGAGVSASPFHCGLTQSGTVDCSGANDRGQTSPPAGTFISVDTGREHACGLRTDGSVSCWGSNDWGQASAPAGTFVGLSAGSIHSCAIRTDGTVACWGADYANQSSPPSGTFLSVSAGGIHSCGIRTGGEPACWGDDIEGEASPPSESLIAISSGHLHSCGLTIANQVVCWGIAGNVPESDQREEYVSVSTGGDYWCALKAEGDVDCWGNLAHERVRPPAEKFTHINSGRLRACGVTEDWRLLCWGGD